MTYARDSLERQSEILPRQPSPAPEGTEEAQQLQTKLYQMGKAGLQGTAEYEAINRAVKKWHAEHYPGTHSTR